MNSQESTSPTMVRAAGLLERMTIEEKAAQVLCPFALHFGVDDVPEEGIGGVAWPISAAQLTPSAGARATNDVQRRLVDATRLGIPALLNEEALCGLKVRDATVFPDGIAQAATWDPDLIEEMSAVIGRQMATVGIRQVLAPVCDVARDARWGRIEETYGEDPYLSGSMAVAYVRGVQEAGAGNVATLKHFIGYGGSEGGRNHYPTHAGPRELREVYGLPFEMAIRLAGARGVMCSYNQVDGVPVQGSHELLTGLLRDEYGFDGVVISDLASVERLSTDQAVAEDMVDAVAQSLSAGLSLELANRPSIDTIVEALSRGSLTEATLDRAVMQVLAVKARIGLLDEPYVDESVVPEVLESPADREVARRVADRSIVLLRNEPVNGRPLLPLAPSTTSIAVIGPTADRALSLLGNYSHPVLDSAVIRSREAMAQQGGDDEGAGRAWAEDTVQLVESFIEVPSVLDAIVERAGDAIAVRHAQGCPIEEPRSEGVVAAARLASECDVAVVVVGDQAGIISHATVGEHVDSLACALPGVQRQLVEAVVATGTPTIVVLTHGRPFALGWMAAQVPAILTSWFGGEEAANAVAAALFGDTNPGGKLPVTFPAHAGQLPIAYNRTFDKHLNLVDGTLDPAFPFGHGLSYTRFEYADLEVTPSEAPTDASIRITCRVTNAGNRQGDEVVQLYLHDVVARSSRPKRELKGFKRITLDAGESVPVTFVLAADRVALFDPREGWVVEPGRVEVMIGSSSADIRLQGAFSLTGPVRAVGNTRVLLTEVELGAG